MGEYGSVLLISGGLPPHQVSSMYAYQQIQNFDYAGAAATATVLLVVSLVVIVGARRPAAAGGPPWLARDGRRVPAPRRCDRRCALICALLYVGVLVLCRSVSSPGGRR